MASVICLQGLLCLLSVSVKPCVSHPLFISPYFTTHPSGLSSHAIYHILFISFTFLHRMSFTYVFITLYHFYLHHCILVDHSIDSFGFCPNWNTTNYLVDSSFPGLLQLVSDSMDHHQSSHSDLVILIKVFYDRSLPPWLETSFNKFMKLHIYDVWATLEFLDQSTEGSFFSSTPMTSLLKKKKSKHSSSLMPSYTSNYSRG